MNNEKININFEGTYYTSYEFVFQRELITLSNNFIMN